MKVAGLLPGLLLIAIPAIADTTATITGIATNEGSPLAGVAVRASSPPMKGTRSVTSDGNGRRPADVGVALSDAADVLVLGGGEVLRAGEATTQPH